MFDGIRQIVQKYEIIIINPPEIDEATGKGKNNNLNWFEADKSVLIINKLKPERAILDCPSPNIVKYTQYVRAKLDNPLQLIVEHKAESYPIVAAASILAKVTRDREIVSLKKKHNVEFGSGYPADPQTIKFLRENWDKYDFFRKTWATYKKVAEQGKQKGLRDF